MKFDRIAAEGRNLFTGYGEGYVDLSGRRLTTSAIVTAAQVAEWPVASAGAITAADWEPILALAPEIVLLGSGSVFMFPDPAALLPLHRARIGIEVMDTRAACRTYNILVGEDRNVAAAIIVG